MAIPSKTDDNTGISPFKVASLSLNGGTSIDTSNADIVVIVGPNNVGKTRTLQEMHAWLSVQARHQVSAESMFVLDGLVLKRLVSGEALVTWLKERRYTWRNLQANDDQIRTSNTDLFVSHIPGSWDNQGDHLGILAGHLMRNLWCNERLQYLAQPSRLEVGRHPDHPIQWLVIDKDSLAAFREAFLAAFGLHVIVDGWGNTIRLRLSSDKVQDDFAVTTTDGLPNGDIAERVAALPLIEVQSDGVRSFAGILLTLLASRYPLVLIDEPEAFLHPPQARLLGRYLAELLREGQIFVATHSLDVLLGLVEARPDRVLVVRLTRDQGLTSSRILTSAQLAELWRDPLLRFSRVLDGLFHDGVVVCEGDTDCQFYSAVKDEGEKNETDRRRDIMFTYAGSKQRIPLVTKALCALGVPVAAVVDFDALRDTQVLQSLVEGLGHEYNDELDKDRRLIDSHVRGGEQAVRTSDVRKTVDAVLGSDPKAPVTPAMIQTIRRTLEPETGWRAAKQGGRSAVPSGDASVALDRLLGNLQSIGLFVVPHGEVESFVKTVPNHGPRWVVEVIRGDHIKGAAEAHKFVNAIMASLT